MDLNEAATNCPPAGTCARMEEGSTNNYSGITGVAKAALERPGCKVTPGVGTGRLRKKRGNTVMEIKHREQNNGEWWIFA